MTRNIIDPRKREAAEAQYARVRKLLEEGLTPTVIWERTGVGRVKIRAIRAEMQAERA